MHFLHRTSAPTASSAPVAASASVPASVAVSLAESLPAGDLHGHRSRSVRLPRSNGRWGIAICGVFRLRRSALLGVGLLASIVTFATTLGVSVASASSAPALPYGEVSHFGSYGTGPKQFVLPVGFAVDAEEPKVPSTPDGNAVYVLDQVLREPGKIQYRLQKLSSTGTVLGTATLPPETYSTNESESNANPLISLAVDPAVHRIYALVESMVETTAGSERFVPVAQRLIAWSTEPEAGSDKLKAASGFPVDALTGAALVAGPTELEPPLAEDDLATPEGLGIEPVSHDVVIEAQHGVSHLGGGPTILQRVPTEGSNVGVSVEGSWIAGSGLEPGESDYTSGGIFDTTGGFGVDVYAGFAADHNVLPEFVAVTNFTDSEPAPLAPETLGGKENIDEAPAIDAPHSPALDGSSSVGGRYLEVFAAGSPVTQLSNGLYAADYGDIQVGSHRRPTDPQTPNQSPSFWTEDNSNNADLANMGIRIFEANGASYHILTTIGGQPVGQECNLDNEQMSLAPGSEGSLFVLTQPNVGRSNEGDEVIEFAPVPSGSPGACPVPSGEVKITAAQGGTELKKGKGGELLAYKGEQLHFDASGIERKGETPFEYNWTFTGAGSPHVSMITEPGFSWPMTTEEYAYQEIGLQEGSLQLYGDYGKSVFPFKIRVLEEISPVANFEVLTKAATAGQAVEFNARESTPTPGGGKIEEYTWNFGDGTEGVSTGPEKSHTYTQAGVYTVKLMVTDEAGDTSKVAAEHQVEVAQESVTTTSSTSTTTSPPVSSSTSTTSTTTTSSLGHVLPPPVVHKPPLTKAQELAQALKLCKKQPKKRRAACDAQAKKKYASATKKKKKKK